MAITYTDNGGGAPNGSDLEFTYTFPVIQTEDVKVALNGVTQSTTKYAVDNVSNPTKITFNNTSVDSSVQNTSGAPKSGVRVRVYRETTVGKTNGDEDPKAVFAAGSSIRAIDLNANQEQALFAIHELQTRPIETEDIQGDAITGDKIADDQINSEHYVAGSIDHEHLANDIIDGDNIQDDVINSEHYAAGSIDLEHMSANSVDSDQYVDGSIDRVHLEADIIDSTKLADNAVNSEHYVDGSIDHVHLANDIIDGDNIQDDVINSEHYVAGSIDEEHIANSSVTANKIADGTVGTLELANGSVTTDKIVDANVTNAKLATGAVTNAKLDNNSVSTTKIIDANVTAAKLAVGAVTTAKLDNNAVSSAKIADGNVTTTKIADDAVRANHIADSQVVTAAIANDAVTIDKIADAAIVTQSEQISHTVNDNTFYTTAAAEARFFNTSSGETIKDGVAFPDNDTTIATTAAINDRIIDIVNDVGGFDIVQSEQHFPNTNPQGQAGSAAVLSIKEASTNLVPSGTTVTIVNGNLANNANITITGVPSTIPSGFGFIVESTGTLHTYTFHRLVPKATEVTTVAGKAVEIGRLGTADAVADMALLGTADVVADLNTLGTADVVADMNMLATSDVISDMNTLAVTDVINDMDTVATNVANVNNVGTNIAKVNSVAAVVGGTQTFVVTVSGGVFYIDGQSKPVLTLARGFTYTFNVSDSSNSGHPLRFKDGSGNSYTTGVTTSGTAGNSGATVVIAVAANAPSSLRYYCTVHGNGMGNTITVTDDNIGTVAGSIANVNTTAGSIANVNTTAGSISNVNTVASNISNVNSFFNVYRIGSSNPTSSLDVGDLFFNTTSNSLKVYTGSAWVDGVTATGNFAVVTGNTFTGSNIHNDNVKSLYGTGSDLEIFHDGTHSYIENTTGDLRITDTGGGGLIVGSNSLNLRNSARNENYLVGSVNGAVDLYYDNSKKFETTSTGVAITGGLTASGNSTFNEDVFFVGDNSKTITFDKSGGHIRFLDNAKAQFGTQGDLHIYHDGSHSIVKDSGTGNLRVQTNNLRIENAAGTQNQALFTEGGSVELYHNNSKKFETTSAGAVVTGTLGVGANTSAKPLHVGTYGSGNGEIALASSTSGYGSILFGDSASGTDLYRGYLQYNHATDRMLIATSAAARITILADGKTGINNSSPSESLDVTGNIAVSGTVDGVDIAALNTTVSNITTDVVDDTTPQLGGNLDANSKAILLGDSTGTLDSTSEDVNRLCVGAGRDFQILHDGNDTYLNQVGTGGLYLRSVTLNEDVVVQAGAGGDVRLRPNAGESGVTALVNGGAELYYDNSKKLETLSTGAKIIGRLGVDKDPDTKVEAKLSVFTATGNDDASDWGANGIFQLTHSGTQATGSEVLLLGTCSGGVGQISSGFGFGRENTSNWGTYLSFKTHSTSTANIDELIERWRITSAGHFENNSDAIRLKLGASDDLELYHDGSNSYVKNHTGYLNLNSNLFFAGTADNLETYFLGVANSYVRLYYDNTKRLETYSGGTKLSTDGNIGRLVLADTGGNFAWQLTGYDEASAGAGGRGVFQDATGAVVLDMRGSGGNIHCHNTIKLNGSGTVDNLKLMFGAGDDLQIYHDGSNSYIKEGGTGILVVNSNSIHINNAINNENMIIAAENGEVDLYYDNTSKAKTASHGMYFNEAYLHHHVNSGNSSEIRFTTNGTRRGSVYADNGNTVGFLTPAGGWSARWHSNGKQTSHGDIVPNANNTYDLGSNSLRWRDIYTNDLNLSNEGGANDVDGTWGNWTIQEGESDLFLKNNRSGKKYKFNLTEVL